MSAKPPSAAPLAAFWFGIQLVWGAILAVSLQARSAATAHNPLIGYATLASLGALIAALTQLVVGPASDRFHARHGNRIRFYLIGTAGSVPALLLFYTTTTYFGLAASFIALQIMLNVATGPYSASIPDHVERGRAGRASSWMSSAQFAGNAAGLVVAGFVSDLRAVAAIIATVLMLSCAVTAVQIGRRRAPEALASNRFRIDGPFQTLLISRGLINLGFYTLLGFLFFFVRAALPVAGDDGLRMTTALLFLTFTLAGICGAAIAARPAERYDRRVVIALCNGVFAISVAALAGSASLLPAYCASAIAGAAWGGFVTADWALACAILPPGAMALAMSVWNLAVTLPQIAAPVLTASFIVRIASASGVAGPRTALYLAAGEVVAGTAWLWRLPRALGSPASDSAVAVSQ